MLNFVVSKVTVGFKKVTETPPYSL